MISALRVCTKCGAEIPADAPEGGCPGCLLESGLGLHPDAPLAVGDASTVTLTVAPDGSSAGDVGENAAAAARQNKKAARVAEILGELGDYELLEVVGVFAGKPKPLPVSIIQASFRSLKSLSGTAHVTSA